MVPKISFHQFLNQIQFSCPFVPYFPFSYTENRIAVLLHSDDVIHSPTQKWHK